MDNRKKRLLVHSTEDDIHSNLSEHLIDLVLERLPIEDAVRTSILSKKWRYRWTSIRVLNLNIRLLKKLPKRGAFHPNGYIRIINNIMINHQSSIFKCVLPIPKIPLDSFQEFNQWMLILSRKNVQELYIYNNNRTTYPLPSSVFSCLSLRRLVIQNCIFNPPHAFQGFPHLEYIFCKNVSFGGNLGGSMINLPQLKWLELDTCSNVNNFNIKDVKLTCLEVVDCPGFMVSRLFICFLKNRENLSVVMLNNKKSNILSLNGVDGHFSKAFATYLERYPIPQTAKCVNQLGFQKVSFGDLDHVQGVFCMLRNTTHLKVLRLVHMQMGPDADHELICNYLESLDCFQTLPMLQTIEITSLEGSRQELLFLKLLLDHSPRLENMIIRPRATTDAHQRLNIAKGVMSYPRASTKAKVVYLDP